MTERNRADDPERLIISLNRIHQPRPESTHNREDICLKNLLIWPFKCRASETKKIIIVTPVEGGGGGRTPL